jgi:hypothetical protein
MPKERHDPPLPTALPALDRQQAQMIGVDLRHQQGDVRRHPVVAGVGDHDVAGGGEVALDLPRQAARHRGEDQPRSAAGHALLDGALGDVGRRLPLELPVCSLAIALAGAAIAGAEPFELEPRMVLQELHEPLAHRAGGAQDSNLDLLVHRLHVLASAARSRD